jgi:methionyl-tRNA synthetase
VRLIGTLLEPFLPATCAAIHRQLGIPATGTWSDRLRWGSDLEGKQVGKAEPLFPRREVEKSSTA